MLSELEAVNRMLLAVGSSVVNTISGQVGRDVAACKTTLARAKTEALLEGWWFNTDSEVPYSPDATGRIRVPEDVLQIDLNPNAPYTTVDPVQRGIWLYNRTGQTYTFAIGQVLKMDVTRDLPWDELPEVARNYIAAKATEMVVAELDGDQALMDRARLSTLQARVSMQRQETGNSDLTIFDPQTDYLIRQRRR